MFGLFVTMIFCYLIYSDNNVTLTVAEGKSRFERGIVVQS